MGIRVYSRCIVWRVSGSGASRPVANKNILRIRHRRTRKANKQEEGGRKNKDKVDVDRVGVRSQGLDSRPDTQDI